MPVTNDAERSAPPGNPDRMISTAPQRILVPTDLSDFAGTALRWGGLFQRNAGAKLTLLFASELYVPIDVIEGPAAYVLQRQPEFRARMADELRGHVERYLPDAGDSVEHRIVDKAPSQAIVETADAIDADLIIMGTHGRTGWRRVLLGSVTETVVHHTNRPVLCIPAGAPPSIKKILCPVDFSTIARAALDQAAELAELFDAELLLVHVTEAGTAVEVAGEFAAWIAPQVRNRVRYFHLAAGNAAEETIRMAANVEADLIVVGAQHKRFADATVIGTTAERVIRFAKRPVLAVMGAAA